MNQNWNKLENEDNDDKEKFLKTLMKLDGSIVNVIMQDISVAIQIIQDYVRFELHGVDDFTKRKLHVDSNKINKRIAERFSITKDDYVILVSSSENIKYPIYYIRRKTLLNHLVEERYPALKKDISTHLDGDESSQ